MDTASTVQSEDQFAALVEALAGEEGGSAQLIGLLREDHPIYDQRGTTTTVRMRGWILLALARAEVSDAALLFVLEELDTGTDPYLVGAAAHTLRAYPRPTAAFAPFLMRALTNIRYRDERVSFEEYGGYAVSTTGTSPVRELLETLAWLGPHARHLLPDIEALQAAPGGLPKKLRSHVDRAVEAIRGVERVEGSHFGTCCGLPGLRDMLTWALSARRRGEPVDMTTFEDHEGTRLTFKELFRGCPSIVVFFYTRCDNPLKCSLTITKLARMQQILETRGLADQIHTAAITYDPEFDLPERMRAYARDRGARMNTRHRMLRAVDGIDAIRKHFKLGVNFIGSLVNRHRIEAYILDAEGRIAACYERIHWDEQQILDRAIEVLGEKSDKKPPLVSTETIGALARNKTVAPVFSTFVSLGVAFFPKCPFCWAGYLSLFGIASLNRIPYSPWLQSVLIVVMVINLASVGLRGRVTGRMSGFYLVGGGALTMLASKMGLSWEGTPMVGVVLTLAGSMLSARNAMPDRPAARDFQKWPEKAAVLKARPLQAR
jgi:protein SCO1/2